MIRIRSPIFLLTPEEREEFVRKEPQSLKYIHKVLGAQEYTNNIERYLVFTHYKYYRAEVEG